MKKISKKSCRRITGGSVVVAGGIKLTPEQMAFMAVGGAISVLAVILY